MHGLQLAVNGPLADDGIDDDVPAGVEPVNAVDGLLELVVGPRVAQQDDIVAEREAVAFGHGIDAGQHDLIGRTAGAELELRGELAAALLAGAAVGTRNAARRPR